MLWQLCIPDQCVLGRLQTPGRLHVDGEDITLLRPDELRFDRAGGAHDCQATVNKV